MCSKGFVRVPKVPTTLTWPLTHPLLACGPIPISLFPFLCTCWDHSPSKLPAFSTPSPQTYLSESLGGKHSTKRKGKTTQIGENQYSLSWGEIKKKDRVSWRNWPTVQNIAEILSQIRTENISLNLAAGRWLWQEHFQRNSGSSRQILGTIMWLWVEKTRQW